MKKTRVNFDPSGLNFIFSFFQFNRNTKHFKPNLHKYSHTFLIWDSESLQLSQVGITAYFSHVAWGKCIQKVLTGKTLVSPESCPTRNMFRGEIKSVSRCFFFSFPTRCSSHTLTTCLVYVRSVSAQLCHLILHSSRWLSLDTSASASRHLRIDLRTSLTSGTVAPGALLACCCCL